MKKNDFQSIVDELSLFVPSGIEKPNQSALKEIIIKIKEIMYPEVFVSSVLVSDDTKRFVDNNLESIIKMLETQIQLDIGLSCADCNQKTSSCLECRGKAKETIDDFIRWMPKLKSLMLSDVEAAYKGDPAAKSRSEVISCYPGLEAILFHRIANKLSKSRLTLIPRIINEMAHSKTGIDINPGAEIGESFFIDHGTGVVIGETCIIGNNVRIYQGVTLGAKSFEKDESGGLIKGMPRHPIIGDNVVIYANATILGRITIPDFSVISGNAWIMQSDKSV